jgi:hypothetical protein
VPIRDAVLARTYEIRLRIGRARRGAGQHHQTTFTDKEAARMVADAGPPLVLMAIGLVLWLAVTATLAGISIHTIGLILFLVGLVWLGFEMLQARSLTRREVVEEPVVYRDRRL